MQADRVAFITPMQDAFMRAEVEALVREPAPTSKLTRKVMRALERNQPRQERAVNARVSYRTAQKLKNEGVL